MKTIILISSIFYILGLKLGNHFDLVKKARPVERNIIITPPEHQPASTIGIADEIRVNATDSVNNNVINVSETAQF